MTHSCWQKPLQAPEKISTDIAIVGAGICGLSLGYWLKLRSPQTRITILDAATIGGGASGRNAGFNTAGSTFYLAQLASKYGEIQAMNYWDFKQESLRLMREHLFSQLSVDHEFWGSTTLYRLESEWQEHSEKLARMRVGQLEKVSALELQKLGLKGFAGGLKFTHEGRVHSLQLLQALKEKLQTMGVEIKEEQSVAWGEDQTECVKLMCSRAEVKAQHVFLALNGYAGEFHPELAKWVTPKRAQMLALDFGPHRLAGNFYDPAHKVYFRTSPESATNTLLVGGMRLLEEATENSDFDKVTPVIQNALQTYAEGIFGSKLPVLARWSGVMGFTQEEKPYIRAVPFLKNTTFVGGFSGHGMGVAFGVAHEAAARFLGVPTRFKDVLPLE